MKTRKRTHERALSLVDEWFLRGVLALVAVGIPVLLIGGPALAWLNGKPLDWEAGVREPGPVEASQVPGGETEFTWDGTAEFTVPDPNSLDRIVAMLPGAAIALMVAAVAILLYRLVAAIGDGRPFGTHTVTALRVIAVLILVAAVLVPFLTSVADERLVNQVLAEEHHVGWRMSIDFVWLGLSMVLFALSTAFSIGTRLTHDVEGLV